MSQKRFSRICGLIMPEAGNRPRGKSKIKSMCGIDRQKVMISDSEPLADEMCLNMLSAEPDRRSAFWHDFAIPTERPQGFLKSLGFSEKALYCADREKFAKLRKKNLSDKTITEFLSGDSVVCKPATARRMLKLIQRAYGGHEDTKPHEIHGGTLSFPWATVILNSLPKACIDFQEPSKAPHFIREVIRLEIAFTRELFETKGLAAEHWRHYEWLNRLQMYLLAQYDIGRKYEGFFFVFSLKGIFGKSGKLRKNFSPWEHVLTTLEKAQGHGSMRGLVIWLLKKEPVSSSDLAELQAQGEAEDLSVNWLNMFDSWRRMDHVPTFQKLHELSQLIRVRTGNAHFVDDFRTHCWSLVYLHRLWNRLAESEDFTEAQNDWFWINLQWLYADCSEKILRGEERPGAWAAHSRSKV